MTNLLVHLISYGGLKEDITADAETGRLRVSWGTSSSVHGYQGDRLRHRSRRCHEMGKQDKSIWKPPFPRETRGFLNNLDGNPVSNIMIGKRPYQICRDADHRAETEERAIIDSTRHGIET